MGLIGGEVGYKLLRQFAPRESLSSKDTSEQKPNLKVEQFFGDDFFQRIEGKTVIDFGCGDGDQAVEMAQKSAAKVIGLDIQEHRLERGRATAKMHGVSDRCVFATSTNEKADIILSKDAFEHFSDPAKILDIMSTLVKPNGYVLAAFGPTWLHPYGGHLFSVFPWSHLVFTEHAQIRWRSDFKNDGATKFSEVAGGLNQLTIAKFEKIVAESPFQIEWLDTVPIKGIPFFKSKLFREFGSSIVRCKLTLRNRKN